MLSERESPCHADLTELIKNLTELPVIQGTFSDSHLGDMIVVNVTRKVAVKVSRVRKSGRYNAWGAFKQFNREVSITKPLIHANITRCLGVTYSLGRGPAIVTEWYPHGDAPTFLKGRSTNERHHVIKGVVKGLCYLHGRRLAIVHGDIKGVNILVNDSFEGVISDFSLSRVVGDGTESGTDPEDTEKINGCISWMARELIYDEPGIPSPVGPTTASDVWAFGCLFYELMLGKLPYSHRKHFAPVMLDIIRGTLPFSQEDAMQVGSSEVWAVVCRCWSPVPGDRPSALELKNILYPLLG